MATIYVKAGATPSSPYASWTDAAAALLDVLAVDNAGDTVYLASTHTETAATAKSIALAGTPENPIRVLSVTEASPPTTLTAGAVIANSGANHITFSGGCYIYGLTVQSGSTSNAANIRFGMTADSHVFAENCTFQLNNTSAAAGWTLGSVTDTDDSNIVLKNCVFRAGSTGQKFYSTGYSRTLIQGGSLSASGSAITVLVQAGKNGNITFEGVDLSAGASTMDLVSTGLTTSNARYVFRNCKLPSGWSGDLVGSTWGSASASVEMYNCAAGDTNYAMWIESVFGAITTVADHYRTGGATNGSVTGYSWKMVSSANANYPAGALTSPEIVIWNEAVGSGITATIEIAQADGATALNQEDCWIEVMYLGTSGNPLALFISDAPTNLMAAAGTDQTTSSETWTGVGWSAPVTQKLSVSFTPQEAGFIHAKVKLGLASKTVYVCPKITVA